MYDNYDVIITRTKPTVHITRYNDMIDDTEYTSENENDMHYTKKDGGLYCIDTNGYSTLSMCKIMRMEFVEIPWQPKVGEKYYCIDKTEDDGFFLETFTNEPFDFMMMSRGKVYRTGKEVLEEINKLGW